MTDDLLSRDAEAWIGLKPEAASVLVDELAQGARRLGLAGPAGRAAARAGAVSAQAVGRARRGPVLIAETLINGFVATLGQGESAARTARCVRAGPASRCSPLARPRRLPPLRPRARPRTTRRCMSIGSPAFSARWRATLPPAAERWIRRRMRAWARSRARWMGRLDDPPARHPRSGAARRGLCADPHQRRWPPAGGCALCHRARGVERGVLGPDGWQVGAALLSPLAVRQDGAEVVLAVGPEVVDRVETGPVRFRLPAVGIDQPLFWPDLPTSHAGSRGPVPLALPRRPAVAPPPATLAHRGANGPAAPPMVEPLAPRPAAPPSLRPACPLPLLAGVLVVLALGAGAGVWWAARVGPDRPAEAPAAAPPAVPPPPPRQRRRAAACPSPPPAGPFPCRSVGARGDRARPGRAGDRRRGGGPRRPRPARGRAAPVGGGRTPRPCAGAYRPRSAVRSRRLQPGRPFATPIHARRRAIIARRCGRGCRCRGAARRLARLARGTGPPRRFPRPLTLQDFWP